MVGAIADWIAVSALFRPIWLVKESDLIAQQKHAIGDELANFVHDKFLDQDSLAALIRNRDIGGVVAAWLTQDANTRRLSDVLLKSLTGLLHLLEEARVHELLKDATRTLMEQVEYRGLPVKYWRCSPLRSPSEVLDQLIVDILDACNQRETREAIAEKIVEWLRNEHRWKQLMLPTEWIGAKGGEIIAEAWVVPAGSAGRQRSRIAGWVHPASRASGVAPAKRSRHAPQGGGGIRQILF